MCKSLRDATRFAMRKWEAKADSGFAISTNDLETMTIDPITPGL